MLNNLICELKGISAVMADTIIELGKLKTEVPEELVENLGVYMLESAGVKFIISYDNGLQVYNSAEKLTSKLNPTKTEGKYLDENGKNIYVFEKNDSGDTTHLKAYYTVTLHKITE